MTERKIICADAQTLLLLQIFNNCKYKISEIYQFELQIRMAKGPDKNSYANCYKLQVTYSNKINIKLFKIKIAEIISFVYNFF